MRIGSSQEFTEMKQACPQSRSGHVGAGGARRAEEALDLVPGVFPREVFALFVGKNIQAQVPREMDLIQDRLSESARLRPFVKRVESHDIEN